MLGHIKKYAPAGFDLVVATHLDDDHIGGLSEVLNAVPVHQLVLNVPGTMEKWLAARDQLMAAFDVVSVREMVEGLHTANSLLKLAQSKNIPVVNAATGTYWRFGEKISLTVASPTPDMLEAAWTEEVLKSSLAASSYRTVPEALKSAPPTTASNNSSIVLELWHNGEAHALFTGDAGADILKHVVYNGPYYYLKVPHHGSRTGLDDELADCFRPHVAHIPVGPNPHGHPDREVREALRGVGARVFCSEKTEDCYPGCERDWGDVICERGGGKPSRPGWQPIDPSKCPANR